MKGDTYNVDVLCYNLHLKDNPRKVTKFSQFGCITNEPEKFSQRLPPGYLYCLEPVERYIPEMP